MSFLWHPVLWGPRGRAARRRADARQSADGPACVKARRAHYPVGHPHPLWRCRPWCTPRRPSVRA